MNFEDEHYVRIYTRDTKTWLRWGWEGQAVFALTARKLDALGRLSVDDPVADVALLTGMPEDVVRVGLKRVLDSGAFVAREGYLECPNWIDGQTATKSDSVRCREYRARLQAKRVIPRAERAADTERVESDTERVGADTGRVESDTSRPSTTHDRAVQPNAAHPIPMQPSADPDRARPQDPITYSRIPADYQITKDLIGRAWMEGTPGSALRNALDYWRSQLLPPNTIDIDQFLLVKARGPISKRKGKLEADQPKKLPGLTGAAARKALENFK